MAGTSRALLAALFLPVLSTIAFPTENSGNDKDNAAKAAGRCCSAIQLLNNFATYYDGDNGYNSSLSSYWSLQARTHPTCIAVPSCSSDVLDITKILVDHKCLFAVRSGGHNPFPDNNIDAPGVTIDLSRLNAVSLSNSTLAPGGQIASIGPGARWGQVYDYLTPKGYAVPGGRAATVGVGGLVIGGGNSFYAARFGFVCDNVENFEVVLATGKIVNANSKENSDLWKALKGGSNNFGVVTRYDITAFPGSDIWGGVVLYPASTIPQQISAFVNFTEKIDKDPYGSLITFWAYSSEKNITIVENAYEYTKPQSNPPAFSELLAIKPEIQNTLRITNLTALTTELEAAKDLRDLFATLSFANNATLISQVYNISQKLLEPLKQTKGLNWITMFQPLPTVISDQGVKHGGNVLGLDRAKGNQVLFLFFVQWSDTADDEKLQTAASSLMKQVKDLTIAQKQDNDWIYLNYALASQDVLGSYGQKNLDFLKATGKKYDPKAIFQKYVPGGFKFANAKPTSQ